MIRSTIEPAAGRGFAAWYRERRHELHRHGLWLRGGELNTLAPDEYERRLLRVLLVRLSTYFDTGYSFTHQMLYQLAAGLDDVYPDLAYLPPRQDLPIFARDEVPWLLGTQSKHGPKGFDVIGFSNSIVQELVNLPRFLEQSGVPLSKEERLRREDLPLLLLGGANALYTSAIWTADPPVDGIFVGEDDGAIRAILAACRDGRRAGAPKREWLARLEQIDGFFQPERPRRTKKGFILDLNRSEPLEGAPVYHLEEQLGSSHLQISEGCPCFCSFCAESWDRKPYRERRAPVLKEAALRAKAAMGLDSVDIYSFNFNMHSGFYQVLWDLVPHFRSIGLKSQRFDLLAHDPLMVEFQHAIEKASLTCGLEGISPRMRRYLHKNLEDGELHDSLTAIFRSRARELKVFLIATGLEEEQDLLAFEDLVGHLRAVRDAHRATTRVIFSMTPLVRFPWTPLEFENAFPMDRYERIVRGAAARARAAGFEFRESADLSEYWLSQVLIRAADERIYAALLETLEETGFVYYRDVPEEFRDRFAERLAARGLDEARLLAGHTLEESHAKPWAAIDTGVKREFLWAEVERARRYTEIDYCLGRSWTRAKCFHCGGCPTREHVRDIVLAKQERGYSLDDFQARVRAARESEREFALLVEVGERGRGVPRKLVAVALARALMQTSRELREHYRGYAGSWWENPERFPVWSTGRDAIRLRFAEAARAPLERLLAEASARAQVDRELAGFATLVGLAPEDWAPERVRSSAPYECDPEHYLRELRLKFTRRTKTEETGGIRFEIAPESLRRGTILDLALRGSEGVLRVGPKFDAEQFARHAFLLPHPQAWIHVRLHAE